MQNFFFFAFLGMQLQAWIDSRGERFLHMTSNQPVYLAETVINSQYIYKSILVDVRFH